MTQTGTRPHIISYVRREASEPGGWKAASLVIRNEAEFTSKLAEIHANRDYKHVVGR